MSFYAEVMRAYNSSKLVDKPKKTIIVANATGKLFRDSNNRLYEKWSDGSLRRVKR